MAPLSPIPAYVLGVPLVVVGLYGLRKPLAAHDLFGVPSPVGTSEPSPDKTHPAASAPRATVSPFVYAKSVRDLTLGAITLGLQYQGNDRAVTTVVGACCLTALADGAIVWWFGGEKYRAKAWGHWLPTVLVLAPWTAVRLLEERA